MERAVEEAHSRWLADQPMDDATAVAENERAASAWCGEQGQHADGAERDEQEHGCGYDDEQGAA